MGNWEPLWGFDLFHATPKSGGAVGWLGGGGWGECSLKGWRLAFFNCCFCFSGLLHQFGGDAFLWDFLFGGGWNSICCGFP